jgi:hypothetical protein
VILESLSYSVARSQQVTGVPNQSHCSTVLPPQLSTMNWHLGMDCPQRKVAQSTMDSFGVSVQHRSRHTLVWTSKADGMIPGNQEWNLPATLKTCAPLHSGALSPSPLQLEEQDLAVHDPVAPLMIRTSCCLLHVCHRMTLHQ